MSHQLFEEKEHTSKYRQHRPGYPKQLYDHILNYYYKGNRTDEHIPLAVDVGCGNGQATIELSSLV
jgi:tRNA G46 methylase TrmB